MNREAWLEERRKGLGGSDAAAALGLSPYRTPVDVYLDKRGEGEPQAETEAMRWGTALEPVIRKRYTLETGQRVKHPRVIQRHPTYPWLLGNVDGLIGKKGVLEVKTARSKEGWGEPGTDQVPVHYLLQGQHYLLVTGRAVVNFAVLFGASEFATYSVPADENVQEVLLRREKHFWENHVLAGVPPEPQTYSDVKALFPSSSAICKLITPEVFTALENLRNLRARLSELKEQEDHLLTEVCDYLKEADTLVDTQGQTLATWKRSKDRVSFETKDFAADHPEVYRQYTRTSPGSRRFLLKGEK